ncbi:hypothetical protein VNO80_25906 [Phaseolus coccineus]|uniref:Uncharacterized protein n=1 Tax=Phaseolus coccineus TaxID=3886 RepID=A0AAN9QTT6_PHACN
MSFILMLELIVMGELLGCEAESEFVAVALVLEVGGGSSKKVIEDEIGDEEQRDNCPTMMSLLKTLESCFTDDR